MVGLVIIGYKVQEDGEKKSSYQYLYTINPYIYSIQYYTKTKIHNFEFHAIAIFLSSWSLATFTFPVMIFSHGWYYENFLIGWMYDNMTYPHHILLWMSISYLSVVQPVEDHLQDGEGDHADSRSDHQGVAVGEGILLLLLDTNWPCQERVSALDIDI